MLPLPARSVLVLTCVTLGAFCLEVTTCGADHDGPEYSQTHQAGQTTLPVETLIAVSTHGKIATARGSETPTLHREDLTPNRQLTTHKVDENSHPNLASSVIAIPDEPRSSLVSMFVRRPAQLILLVLVFAYFGGRELMRTRS